MADPEQASPEATASAQSIQSQIQAQAEAEQSHRLEVQMEAQGRIFQVTQDITAHKGEAVHDATADHDHQLHHMDGYIRGYAEPDHDHPIVVTHHDEGGAHADPAADAGHEVA